jgi:lipopolysaccharide heptosyltransferase II
MTKRAITIAALALRRAALQLVTTPFRVLDGNAASKRGEIRGILFIRIDRVGDLVLSTPAIRALKEGFPSSKLTVLAGPAAAALLEHNPHVDHVIVYDRSRELRVKVVLAHALRRMRFDLAVDPYDDRELETAWIAGASGAPLRIGYPCGGREAFLTRVVKRPQPDQHMVETVTGVLTPLGIHAGSSRPEIFLTASEVEGARRWLTQQGSDTGPFVAIHPGAFYETQRWPVEYYAALADRIIETNRLKTILFGGPGDEEIVDRILSLTRTRLVRCVTADIRLFAARLSQCSLLVCNNSGPLHVGAALGVPTVSFMGPTVRQRWYPRGERHVVLRIDELPCIGCNAGTCRIGTHDCMRKIRPERVMEAIVGAAGILMPGHHQKLTGHEDNRLHPLPE